jgi:bacteriorhodopsin
MKMFGINKERRGKVYALCFIVILLLLFLGEINSIYKYYYWSVCIIFFGVYFWVIYLDYKDLKNLKEQIECDKINICMSD